jgi:PHP family Zn ribbon phosphoesterase
MIENLKLIKNSGIGSLLESEERKWKCPECGGTISCHNGICYSCGLEVLSNRKNRYRWEDDLAKGK